MQLLTSGVVLIAMFMMSIFSTTVNPVASVAASDTIGVASVVACRDTTTVTVSGSSSYATTRVQASVSYLNSKNKYILLQQMTSSNFGSGSFWLPLVLDYHTQPVDAGTALEVIVQLQRSSGSGFVNFGDAITTYVNAADRDCQNRCSVTISTSDRAPTQGVITLRSQFGSWFRPEGRLQGVTPVNAGQRVLATLGDVQCNGWIRAWFYPATGANRTPRMLPSQLWPSEFGIGIANTSVSYATSFAQGLPATKPLESDDPYAPK